MPHNEDKFLAIIGKRYKALTQYKQLHSCRLFLQNKDPAAGSC
jgi:hypothetical protein